MNTMQKLFVALGLIVMTTGCGSSELERPEPQSQDVGEPHEPPGKVLPEQIDPAPTL